MAGIRLVGSVEPISFDESDLGNFGRFRPTRGIEGYSSRAFRALAVEALFELLTRRH